MEFNAPPNTVYAISEAVLAVHHLIDSDENIKITAKENTAECNPINLTEQMNNTEQAILV